MQPIQASEDDAVVYVSNLAAVVETSPASTISSSGRINSTHQNPVEVILPGDEEIIDNNDPIDDNEKRKLSISYYIDVANWLLNGTSFGMSLYYMNISANILFIIFWIINSITIVACILAFKPIKNKFILCLFNKN